MRNKLMQVEITNGDIVVDAVLLGELLDLQPAEVPVLMSARNNEHLRKGRRRA